jgi:hypothetical protein
MLLGLGSSGGVEGITKHRGYGCFGESSVSRTGVFNEGIEFLCGQGIEGAGDRL